MNEVQIQNALDKFKQLLIEQDERNQKIKSTKDFKDFKSLDKIIIGVCGGDGIGPIITNEAANVLKFILKDDVDNGKVEFKNICCFVCDDGTDTVAAADTDDYLVKLRIVKSVACSVDSLNSLKLLL